MIEHITEGQITAAEYQNWNARGGTVPVATAGQKQIPKMTEDPRGGMRFIL